MKNDFNFMGLSPEHILMLRQIKEREARGEIQDPQTKEALKAIDLASKIVGTIMSGNQIDPVFFKQISDLTQQRIENLAGPKPEKTSVKKKKKLKRKIKT